MLLNQSYEQNYLFISKEIKNVQQWQKKFYTVQNQKMFDVLSFSFLTRPSLEGPGSSNR